MSVATQANPRLAELTAAGTSVWLDEIRRGLVEGGELERLIVEDSLRGVTSNPAIFEKAILGSEDYDSQLAALAQEGLDALEVYRRLAVHDVQLAAEALRAVWDDTGGHDGFVSLEVAPRLARDTDGTLDAARMFRDRVDRPNTMIKIPGTDEGAPAIEQAIYEGINVNVTLLFSVEAYALVAEAYIRGLERRLADDLPLDVRSVASFFVSRIDTEVDKRLVASGHEELRGTAALANARAAYRRFEQLFRGERFRQLREAGAHVQRPLWASTGVKDPSYPTTMYVDELVGADTVNTMPMQTLLAVAKEGRPRPGSAGEDPSEAIAALAAAGIDLDDVTAKLLEDGLRAFEVAMERLLEGIEERRQAVVTQAPPTLGARLPSALERPLAVRLEAAVAERVAQRIWRKDPTLWAEPGTAEIEDRLGWLTVSDPMLEHAADLREFTSACRESGLVDAVLLGMGGSSLGPEVIRRSFGDQAEGLRMHVLDSTDPGAVLEVERAVDLERSLFIVSSKSGGTIETLSHFAYFHESVRERLGDEAGSRFVAVTDPGSPLAQLARDHGFRRVFENPPDIGGRYSVMSYFGLVPAVLQGVPIESLLHRCQVGEQTCAGHRAGAANPGVWLGAAVGEMAARGRDKLTFYVSEPIESFGLWAEQLIAESTGKLGRGIVPVADEPLVEAGRYGEDRVFAYLRRSEQPDEQLERHVAALVAAGQPVLTLPSHGATDLGRIFFLAEFATAVAGWALHINPFDQPNVQEAKDNTARVLERYTSEGALPSIEAAGEQELRRLLGAVEPPRYLAVMAYAKPSDALDGAIADLRATILERTGAATTFGYGPRYLHSTGQLHKGGAGNGVFLQLLHDGPEDVEIPGAAYSFRTLRDAQATGDLETLRGHGLPAERVRLEGDPAEAVEGLTKQVREMLG